MDPVARIDLEPMEESASASHISTCPNRVMVVNERADDTELGAHFGLGDMAPIGMIEVH
jgi:hypothetical protein